MILPLAIFALTVFIEMNVILANQYLGISISPNVQKANLLPLVFARAIFSHLGAWTSLGEQLQPEHFWNTKDHFPPQLGHFLNPCELIGSAQQHVSSKHSFST
jgi:hypothetical protein